MKEKEIIGEKLVTRLFEVGFLEKEDVRRALDFASIHETDAVEYLLREGSITKQLLGEALAESYGLPYADLRSDPPSRELVRRIPETTARTHRVLLFKDADGIKVTTDDPELAAPWVKHLQLKNPDRKVTLMYSLSEDIDQTFIFYRPGLDARLKEIIGAEKRIAPEIIEELFDDALAERASDIHFDPREREVLVRFRVDGQLREVARIPKAHYESVLNHVKVKARMRIDEHFSAQDGALRHQNFTKAEMRVSVAPTLDGEKIAIRILSEYLSSHNLANLGLSTDDHNALLGATRKPFGMIVVAGPTGSGKTTTLYTILQKLNRPEINITTIEDPVEYKIPGINQMQVNPETNLTFASGLRSVVRQDPNIILVGEIRDRETAEIAVNAALTGHLLLSTFHANDAATVIPRLLDMGVEPFLLASTLEMIVAQRLVRKICPDCRISVPREAAAGAKAKRAPGAPGRKAGTVYEGKGCHHCDGTGYRGRTAIFEIIRMTPELQALILRRPSMKEVWALAKRQGARDLFEDGTEKVKTGATTLDELYRVAKPYGL